VLILCTAIGFTHNSVWSIPEIPFLASVHNAEDQIRGEASTLAFFSQGQFTNPMVIRVAGLAYQKGFGGHFHNDNSLAIFRDIPGLLLGVPSNGPDAVGMMRTLLHQAHSKGRVAVFVEPIALYMTKDLHQDGDKEWSFPYPGAEFEIPLGQTKAYGEGQDLLILTYGNGVYHSLRAQKLLSDEHKVKSTVLDLRWLSPLPWDSILEHGEKFKNILIVDECRKTGSLSEGLVSGLVENLSRLPRLKVLAADDCFIPLGFAAAAGLPKAPEILKAALDVLALKRDRL